MSATKTVWKYVIDKSPGVSKALDLPEGSSPLRAAFQGDDLCVWFCVSVPAIEERRLFQYTATGQDVDVKAKYIGSATHAAGTEWHVWEV